MANLDNERYILYHIGQYKYYDDIECRYKYITEKIVGVTGKRRHSDDTILKAVKPVLRNEMTIQNASSQCQELLNLSTVPSTIWRWIDIVEIDEDEYTEIAEKVVNSFSEHLSIDEVYDNGDGIIFLTDPINDTILDYNLVDGKVCNSDIKDSLVELKAKLISSNRELKSCVRDGSPLYINSISDVFPLAILQICIFHLIKMLLKFFMNWHKELRQEVKTDKLPRGLKGKARSIKQFLFQTRTLFVKKCPSKDERVKLKSIMEAYPDFRKLRYFFLRFIRIFSASTLKEARNRFWSFICEPLVDEKLPSLKEKLLKYYYRNELFSYLKFGRTIRKKIRTSNHTERVNRKFRKKQKTHYRIRKTKRREKMLRFMTFFHNSKALKLDKNTKVVFRL